MSPILQVHPANDAIVALRDLDAGAIITGAKTVEQMGEDMLELVIATASGDYTPKAVALGQDDFLPWKRGVSL